MISPDQLERIRSRVRAARLRQGLPAVPTLDAPAIRALGSLVVPASRRSTVVRSRAS